MKAPDVCERWMWQDPQEIIERLLSISSRTVGLPAARPVQGRTKDRYYTLARRCVIKAATKRAMRGRR